MMFAFMRTVLIKPKEQMVTESSQVALYTGKTNLANPNNLDVIAFNCLLVMAYICALVVLNLVIYVELKFITSSMVLFDPYRVLFSFFDFFVEKWRGLSILTSDTVFDCFSDVFDLISRILARIRNYVDDIRVISIISKRARFLHFVDALISLVLFSFTENVFCLYLFTCSAVIFVVELGGASDAVLVLFGFLLFYLESFSSTLMMIHAIYAIFAIRRFRNRAADIHRGNVLLHNQQMRAAIAAHNLRRQMPLGQRAAAAQP